MPVLFSYTKDAEFEGATVTFSDGSSYPVSSDHPKFAEIRDALWNDADEDTIFGLVSPFDAIFKNFTHITDRISRKGNTLYFDGDALGTSIAAAIVDSMNEEGFDNKDGVWPSYVAFLERLMNNPSQESREHFYKFVESHGLTITPDGMVVLYKGVNETKDPDVFRSSNSGYGIVTTPDGVTTEYQSAPLPNGVGYVVSIPRSMVDDNRNRHCSNGLHAGTHEYASDFAPVLLTVLVDPRDVVAVPNDYNNAKVRVSKYKVIEVNADKVNYGTGVVDITTNADADEDDDTELSDDEIYARDKLAEFKALIPTLVQNGEPLRRYRNKRVTAKGRPFFDQAVADLGLSY